jgi:hypothetical protein
MTTPYASFGTEGTYSPDNLVANNHESLIGRKIIIASGNNLVRGSVIGKITTGTISVGTVTFAGTGNGTCTKATPAYSAAALNGSYTAVCVEKTTDSGTFNVVRPNGTVDGVATVGVAYDGQVKFTIADGSTDFAAGDAFTIPVTASGSGKYVLSTSAATDGSQTPDLILAENADATSADVSALAYARGDFITSALTIGAGHTAASITEGLRTKGITLLTAIV